MKVELDLKKNAVSAKKALVLPIGGSLEDYAEFTRQYLRCAAVVVKLCKSIPLTADELDIEHISQGADPAFVVASALLEDADGVIMPADLLQLADPIAVGRLGFSFYAGLPLYLDSGEKLGMIAAIDTDPRTLSGDQMATLKMLAGIIVQTVNFRLAVAKVPFEAGRRIASA